MANASQIKAGIGDYISQHMMAKLDNKRQFVLGMAYGLFAGRLDAILAAVQQNATARALGIVRENGEIDLDAIYNAALAQMQQQGNLSFDIPFMGTFAFNADDIRDIYNAIEGRINA